MTANSEAITALRQGWQAWTRWKQDHPGMSVDLGGQHITLIDHPSRNEGEPWDFTNCVLRSCTIKGQGRAPMRLNFASADLTETVFLPGAEVQITFDKTTVLSNTAFSRTSVTHTDFTAVRLNQVDFFKATLANTHFGKELVGAKFDRARLLDVDFLDTKFVDCSFSSADLSNCVFDGATFSTTSPSSTTKPLEQARFTKCSFKRTNLGQFPLSRTQFDDCDLREASGISLDSTVMLPTVLSPGASDHWLELSRRYTGANMVFNLIALLVYFSPFVIQAIILTGASHLEQRLARTHSLVRGELNKLPDNEYRAAALRVIDKLRNQQREACLTSSPGATVRANPACLSVFSVVFGLYGDWKWPALVLSVALLLYNACRLLLTMKVAPLRDEERRSLHSPAASSYAWMASLHRWFLRWFAWVAIMAAVGHVLLGLAAPIWMPTLQ